MPYLLHDSKLRPPPLPQEARGTHSSGKAYQELKQECLRSGCLFEDPDFPANNASLFFSEKPPIPFLWKRPGDIVKDPKFILGGATRTDICQGDLGDCWLLAAIASLTLNEKTLARVVPLDQNFGPGYAGIFHFQFWQHNEWLDVVIDDRLPTFKDRLVFVHSAERNEFWSALLEKAYAKLNGSYEALKGGSTIEAMEDFTGGVGEMYEVKKAPNNFYEILEKALERSSMVGCSIDTSSAAESEARTPFGLIKGHAYSVTGIDEVSYRGQKVQLIRIRNPWGQVEWNGPWSDKMKFEDFKVHFDKVEICNLTPDALEDSTARKWESPGGDEHLSKDFFRYHASKARSKTYINLREVSDRFKLPPGDYILVPTTFEPHQEADFCLRIFSEKKAITEDLDENVAIDLPEPPNPTPSPQETEEEKQFRALFEQISGKDMEVDAEELEYILNTVLKNTKDIKFKKLSLISCRNIISLMDKIFLQFDFDKSGSMSSYELRSALKAAGYQLNNYLLQLIVLRYSDEQFQIDFDDFLNCLVRLENASRVFQALSVKDKDFINLNIGERTVCVTAAFHSSCHFTTAKAVAIKHFVPRLKEEIFKACLLSGYVITQEANSQFDLRVTSTLATFGKKGS
ncbi:hypothetical protein ASZ78_017100 [Callipepla squamata]|uniref:CAN9 protein n=1 Tax=Callipepla squamata TaxID=9009 RepID=A0A226NDG3_CALSU|nr:hypothetical protein ASZ78_017100 [Callipepla squamata]